MGYLSLILLAVLVVAGPVQAQVSMNDLISPNKKTSCADTVSVSELVENADLAFTGRVIKRDENFTWFRVYVAHGGAPKGGIIKTAGFFASKDFYAGAGQSYETGEVYTAIVHRPQTKQEKKLGVDFINSLDKCQEAVVSKVHDRYGTYRVEPEKLEPGFWQKLGNHFFHFKAFYVLLLLVGAAGAAYIRFKEKAHAIIARLKKSA